PFNAERRIVVVEGRRIFSNQFKKSEQKKMQRIIDHLSESTILLVKSINQPDKRTKLYRAFKDDGTILEFDSLQYQNLDRWIKKTAANLGHQIDSEALQLLKEVFNNDLQRLEQELEKISIFIGSDDQITVQQVKEIISQDKLLKDNIIFDFVDAVGKQNVDQALNLLNQMIEDGQTEMGLLMMIVRQIRLILQSKVLYQQGKSAQQIAQRLNQHPYPIKKCIKQSRNFSIIELEEILELLLESNINLVTGQDQKLELELLILKIKEIIRE
ncbi:MAG: DNA polymerase III subunit delta, partial [Bacillota bacterium]